MEWLERKKSWERLIVKTTLNSIFPNVFLRTSVPWDVSPVKMGVSTYCLWSRAEYLTVKMHIIPCQVPRPPTETKLFNFLFPSIFQAYLTRRVLFMWHLLTHFRKCYSQEWLHYFNGRIHIYKLFVHIEANKYANKHKQLAN